jgi:ATP-dependent DNA helicase RecG
VIDRTMRAGITEAPEGTIATLKVRVDRHQPSPPGRRSAPYRVYVHDDTGEMALDLLPFQAGLARKDPAGW